MQVRSPSTADPSTGASFFSAGTDSPVSAASSTCRFFTASRRMSAGTLSPAASWTTSPGTRSAAGTVSTRPSRVTVAFCGTMSDRASMAWPALYSWIKPMMALITTTDSTTNPSVILPRPTARVPEPSSTQMSGLLICRQSRVRMESAPLRRIWLGPYWSSRRRASSLVRPEALLSRRGRVSSAGRVCQAGVAGPVVLVVGVLMGRKCPSGD